MKINKKLNQSLLIVLIFLSTITLQAQRIIIVKPSDTNINTRINNAKPGDEFRFEPGTYPALDIRNVNGTQNKPIVLKRNKPNGIVNFKGSYNVNSFWSGKVAGKMFNCKYVAFDGLTFSRGSTGVHVLESDHIIFKDCEIFDIGSTGIKFSKRTQNNNSSTDYTHHIDWIGGKVHNTGNSRKGQYGEAFYVGQARQNYDLTHDIWIEGVEIYDITGAEAVDVKAEVWNVTIKNCHIHDIKNVYARKTGGGDDQVNSGAIQVLTEPRGNDRTTRHHELWIEDNLIEKVTAYSQNNEGPRGTGITILGRAGVYVKNNTIRNVQHDAIYGFPNGGIRPGYTSLIDQKTINQMSNIGQGYKKVNIRDGNYKIVNGIKKNPNAAQTWYKPNTSNPDPDPNPGTDKIVSVSAPNSVVSGNTATVSVEYTASRNRDIIVSFQKDTSPYTTYGIKRVSIPAGSRTLTIEIPIGSNTPIAHNAYQFQTYITKTGKGWNDRLDNLVKRDIDCVSDDNTPNSDKIIAVSVSTIVSAGGSATVTLEYTATADRDIIVRFQLDQSPWTNYKDVKLDVAAGSGDREVMIPIPDNVPTANDAYQFQVFITKNGKGWNDRLDNLSKGDIDCISDRGAITIRAKGTCGKETMKLKVNGNFVKTWNNVSTSYRNYTFTNYSGGKIEVHFTNDGSTNGCNRNLTVDHVTVCNTTYQTENKATRTGCGDAQTLWCNGRFDFGNVGCSNRSVNGFKTKEIIPAFTFSNPISNRLEIQSQGVYNISVYNTSGRPVLDQQNLIDNQVIELNKLPEGMYFVTYKNKNYKQTKKLIIKR